MLTAQQLAILNARPHYAGEFAKAALILRSGVHTILPRSFSKTLFKPEECENAGFALYFERKETDNKAL